MQYHITHPTSPKPACGVAIPDALQSVRQKVVVDNPLSALEGGPALVFLRSPQIGLVRNQLEHNIILEYDISTSYKRPCLLRYGFIHVREREVAQSHR